MTPVRSYFKERFYTSWKLVICKSCFLFVLLAGSPVRVMGLADLVIEYNSVPWRSTVIFEKTFFVTICSNLELFPFFGFFLKNRYWSVDIIYTCLNMTIWTLSPFYGSFRSLNTDLNGTIGLHQFKYGPYDMVLYIFNQYAWKNGVILFRLVTHTTHKILFSQY